MFQDENDAILFIHGLYKQIYELGPKEHEARTGLIKELLVGIDALPTIVPSDPLRKRFEQLLVEYPSLTGSGLPGVPDKAGEGLMDRISAVTAAYVMIRCFYLPASTFKKSSYGFKHDIEKYLGSYTSNGELMLALFAAGIQGRPSYGQNYEFKVKLRSRKTQTLFDSIIWHRNKRKKPS